jgi:hypothetical protein
MMQVVKRRWQIGVGTPNFSCESSHWVLGLKLKTSGAFFGGKHDQFLFEATPSVILNYHLEQLDVASHFGAFRFRTIQVLF